MNRWKAFKHGTSKHRFIEILGQDIFLSKKCFVQMNLITQNDADSSLKVAVKSGYKRASFKLGKRFFDGKGNKSELGTILVKKARDQQYYKSIDFLDQHENSISEEATQENEQMAYFAFAKELYHGTVIAQVLMMSFSLFTKFFMSKEPDLGAGYCLSKKKCIQTELITPEQARNALVISAKSGYKRAKFGLGKLYYLHEGINLVKKQNFKKAIEFLKKIKNQQVKLKSEEDFRNIRPLKQQQQEQPEDEFGNIIPLKQQQPEGKFGNNNNNNDNNNNNENNNTNLNNNNNDNNNIGDNIALAEIKVNDGVDNANVNKKHLINAHKSVTSSNIE